MSDNTEGLDISRRYLRPVRATVISDDPEGVHLAVYSWLEPFEAWATGPGLCGESMQQGPLPEGTKVTCSSCLAYQPKYERMLAPGYRPKDDDPEALRKRAEAAEALLQQYLSLVAVTHKYRAMGGHDCLGKDLTCWGCELAEQVKVHLGMYR
ncbi:hypothetical protein ACWC4D_40870 [Streptomyces sp. NPDC001288]